MENESSPRRRDVLRAGAAAGILGVSGFALDGVSAQDQQAENAFSFSLQDGDQFEVRFRPSDPEGNPATQTIPGGCLESGRSPEFQLFIVRAYRSSIDLGYRGLFVPEQAIATQTTTTTPETETTTPAEETTTAETETTPVEETTTPENATTTSENTTTTPTTETTAEAALQDETTTPANETTTTTPENVTTTPENVTTTPIDETTTPAEETTTEETTTPEAQAELPEIQIGEWYSVASSARCEDLYVLTLETAEPRETATGETGTETTTQ